MNFKSYGPRMVVFLIAASVTLVGAAGATWAASADDLAAGAERERVAAAAVKAVGGGTATDVEHSDDVSGAYEVEIRKPDGSEVDVVLDSRLKVIHRDLDDNDDDFGDNDDDDAWDDRDDAGDAPLDNDDNPDASRTSRVDADDRALTDTERTKATAAAVKAVGSGTATDVEASDDLGTAFEAEVIDRAGAEWDVELDANYAVVSKTKDD
jgi:uncharacterized membrane protein YkoI